MNNYFASQTITLGKLKLRWVEPGFLLRPKVIMSIQVIRK